MKKIFSCFIALLMVSCNDGFLERAPLGTPSSETFWTSAENAEMWINNLYRSLPGAEDALLENWSDNAYSRTEENGRVIANGTFQPNTDIITERWNYSVIRQCLEFLNRIEEIPNINQERKNGLLGQARFILAFEYFKLISLYRDVPLVTTTLSIVESDVPKSKKEEVLAYLLEQLNQAVNELPDSWPAGENGRATKWAALALKSRVLLYNERWSEAAQTARSIIDANRFKLHPVFGELFLKSNNNSIGEVILSKQYALTVNEHDLYRTYGIQGNFGYARVLPLPSLADAFECVDGLPISESPLYDRSSPFDKRDPRFAATFIYPYQDFNGYHYDPFDSDNASFSLTYLHYRKYIDDQVPGQTHTHVNWILFRYAEVLLTYAEAKNEEGGPDDSIYNAIDEVRQRAGMPAADRSRYNTKEKLRELIRNERRVELAAEGLRYHDIIRWRIAEDVLNQNEVKSIEVPGLLPVRILESRFFDKNKHSVWPIPQYALDRSKVLAQHDEWK